MSRCFPFPPPGYEKKAKIDDTDLLTKEKHKEKKHKKDKKDKEKREGKEKKDKDKERSKEKHRNNNDRKEKHKDKKDRDKDGEKNSTSDAKKIEGQPERCNGEKLGSNCLQNREIKDSKFMQELARRIKDEGGATGSQIGQKIIVTDQRGGKLPGRLVEHSTDSQLEEKERAKDKKVNGQRNHIEARGLPNAIVQGFSGTDKKVFQGIVKPEEKNDIWKQVEEKNKHKESDSKYDKYKDKHREKKSKSKDKDTEKERKKEEKTKEIRESNKDLLRLNDSGPKLKGSGKDFLNSGNIKPPGIIKTNNNSSAGEGSLGKRKELQINGILHDNGIRPNKLLRPVSLSHTVMENGRKPAIHFASEQGAANNHKVDMKEHKMNGTVCSTKPLTSIVQVSENGEAALKQPHPDIKYLNQILSIPKVEDWCDHDDQEWLLTGNSLQLKKPKVGSPGTQQVWAEAVQIEGVDLIALPYVIPY